MSLFTRVGQFRRKKIFRKNYLEIYSKFPAYTELYKGRQDESLGQLLNLKFLFVTLWLCKLWLFVYFYFYFNPLTPNDHYSGRTAPLTSKCCIWYIYSTNIGTEYFKHGIYSPFFFSSKCTLFHNSNVFGSCFIHILYTGCAKIKKK